jgi:hypothetical protein
MKLFPAGGHSELAPHCCVVGSLLAGPSGNVMVVRGAAAVTKSMIHMDMPIVAMG